MRPLIRTTPTPSTKPGTPAVIADKPLGLLGKQDSSPVYSLSREFIQDVEIYKEFIVFPSELPK